MIDIGKDLKEAYEHGYNDRDNEIVRCKDCYHYNKGENERESWEECNRTMKSTSADDFCSCAKKKGGNDD